MAEHGETTPFSIPYESERGAGGKLRRQPARKPAATPYARPPQNQAQRSRWISRLVDPAYRLIAGGATKILPYLFSKAAGGNALPAPDTQEQDQNKMQNESKKHADVSDHSWSLNHLESRSTEVRGPSSIAERAKSNLDVSARAKGKMVLNNDDGLLELENLMGGRKFSRDETERLIEIIRSRTVDLPDAEQEKKGLEMPLEQGAKRSTIGQESAKKSVEDKKENMNTDFCAMSTPLPKSTKPDEIGLSPAELARAYMGGQTSTLGSKTLISRDGRDALQGDELAAKPFDPSSSCKPPACWPGAMLSEQYGYATPQSQRERFGLHSFPRTPYSRTIHSKSKPTLTQLQDDSSRRLNSHSPFQQLQTSYGQFKSRSKIVDTEQGSVGPIRRIRHKAATETPSRGSAFSLSSRPSHVENPNVYEGFFPSIKKNAGGGTSSSSMSQAAKDKHKSSGLGTPTVHPRSSQIARTVLEHLERSQPTPKDKAAELKLATSWRKSESSDVHGQINSSSSSRIDFSNPNNSNKDSSARLIEDKGNFLINLPSGTTNDAENATNKITPASNGIAGKTLNSQTKNKHEDSAKDVPNSSGIVFQPNLPKPPSHSLGTKPVLPSISVTKPMQRWAFPSDTSSGFTFPIPSSCGVSSEPPTPSIMPSTANPPINTVSQKAEERDEIPSYSFGTKRGTPPLVFSFPSTSNAPTNDDASDIKFTFGSDNTRRVSFSCVGI